MRNIRTKIVNIALKLGVSHLRKSKKQIRRHLLHLATVEGLKGELVLIGVEERQTKLVAVGQNHLTVSLSHLFQMTLKRSKPSNIEAALDPSISAKILEVWPDWIKF